MATSSTTITNMALARIGSSRVNDLDTDANVQAVHARLFYEQDRNALLREHWWRFSAARAILAAHVTGPTFGFDYRYALPSDFLALRYIWNDSTDPIGASTELHAIEGLFIMSDESPMDIVYSKLITDPAEFDPLFVEVLSLKMALHLIYPLVKVGAIAAADRIRGELETLMPRVTAMDHQEQNLVGRSARRTWLSARKSTGLALRSGLGD